MDDGPYGDAKLAEGTRIIPAQTAQRITGVSEDGTIFAFEGDDTVLANLKLEDVLIFERSTKTPFGALRKVSGIERSETNGVVSYVITTDDATIEEAFDILEINTSTMQLNPMNVDSIVYFVESTGVSKLLDLDQHLKDTDDGTFSHPFNIYLHGSTDDPMNSVRFSGNIEFLSELLFSMKLRLTGIREIVFSNKNTITLQAELYAGIQQSIGIDDKVIMSYYLTPFAVGPVVVAPVIQIPVTVLGSAGANFRPNVVYEIGTEAELKYTSGNWSHDSGFVHNFTGEMPMPEVNASMTASIGPRLNLLIYGIVGPNATALAYAEGMYSPQNDPQIELYAGAKFDIGMRMQILSWLIASANINLWDYNTLIYSYSSDMPEISTRPVTNITATSAQSGGIFESEGSQNVTQKGVCWSTSPSPDINNNCTNDGSGTSDFTSTLSSLQPNTQYYVRAYAIVGGEVLYGADIEFITNSENYILFETFSGTDLNIDIWDIYDTTNFHEPGLSMSVNDTLIIQRGPTNNNNGFYGIISKIQYSNISEASVDVWMSNLNNWQDHKASFHTPIGAMGYFNFGSDWYLTYDKSDGTRNMINFSKNYIADKKYSMRIRIDQEALIFEWDSGSGFQIVHSTNDFSTNFNGQWSNIENRVVLSTSDRGYTKYDNLILR